MANERKNKHMKMYLNHLLQLSCRMLLLTALIIMFFTSCDRSVEPSLYVYNFGGLEKLSPIEQVNMIKEKGYKGLILQMASQHHVENLPVFLSIADADNEFEIPAVFIRYNFDASVIDRNRWRNVVDLIKGKSIVLWVIFGPVQPNVNDDTIEGVLNEMLDYTTNKSVKIAVYPHSDCYFETCEQVLPIIQHINHPNLSTVLHTCHELKAGNGHRLNEVIENSIDYLSFVTIAGANQEINFSTPRTRDTSTIKPIGVGEFDLTMFVSKLKKEGYDGDYAFINFGIDRRYDLESYLESSLREWELIENKYLSTNDEKK